jgi:hypothetical protein
MAVFTGDYTAFPMKSAAKVGSPRSSSGSGGSSGSSSSSEGSCIGGKCEEVVLLEQIEDDNVPLQYYPAAKRRGLLAQVFTMKLQ